MSVTAAKGFTAAGIAAGIKENGNPDLALVVNTGPRRAAAGVFTSNRVKAAPVLWSEQVLKSGQMISPPVRSANGLTCRAWPGSPTTSRTPPAPSCPPEIARSMFSARLYNAAA